MRELFGHLEEKADSVRLVFPRWNIDTEKALEMRLPNNGWAYAIWHSKRLQKNWADIVKLRPKLRSTSKKSVWKPAVEALAQTVDANIAKEILKAVAEDEPSSKVTDEMIKSAKIGKSKISDIVGWLLKAGSLHSLGKLVGNAISTFFESEEQPKMSDMLTRLED